MKYMIISKINVCIHDVEWMDCIDTLHNVNGLLGLNKKCTNYLCGVNTCPKVIYTHSCKCLWKWFTQPPRKCKFIYEGKFKCNESVRVQMTYNESMCLLCI